MICKFCRRIITPEKTEKLEVWGIIQEFRCPKCRMFLGSKLTGFNEKKKGFKSVKEILEELNYKDKFKKMAMPT